MRITIHGSYGTGNRGDNVILAQLLRFLEAQTPGAEVTILCRDVNRTALLLDAEFPETGLTLSPVHASFRRRPLDVIRACRACDLFILGGGGLLWGKAPGNLSYWLQRPRLAMAAGKPVVLYVPGIYGIEGHRALSLLGRFGKRVDFLSVRDDEGLEQLVRAGIPRDSVIVGADPAFLLPPPEPGRIDGLLEVLSLRGRRLVGLSARDWRSRLSAGIFAKFVQSLLEDPDATLLFFALKTGGLRGETDTDDLAVAASLLRTLDADSRRRVLVVDENYSIHELIALVGACDYLIGMRLHSLIFASIAGTPFGAVAYDAKIEAYMRMLGREHALLDMASVSAPENLLDLAARLADERRAFGGPGPIPAIVAGAAELSARARAVHEALGKRLRERFGPAGDEG